MISFNQDEDNQLKKIFIDDFNNIFAKIKNDKEIKNIAIICVGTDRITGDSFGPIVGTKLTELFKEDNISNINIYGTLENNINYSNIENIISKLNTSTCIIVVDAALSKRENIGKIFVSNSKTVLGKGVMKNKIKLGDISIKSVVGKDYKLPHYNFKILQNISLNSVIKMSNITADGIYYVIKNTM